MTSSTSTSPAPEAVRVELARMLASDQFVNSEPLSRFLRFTVEQTLAGHGARLKEYAIAVEVLGRKQSFDPRSDAIVRVQAMKLRSRLKEYYESRGAYVGVRIEYAKGSYVPIFEATGETPAAPPTRTEPASIAVLPFVNVSPDPENEYFSDGLTEELISALSNLQGLRVVARTSVFQFKGKSEDIRKIGAQLNAQVVLEGSVRKSGNRLRITAQLIDVASGYHTWSRTYRVEMQDVFSVQEEIAHAIAATLSERERRTIRRPTENLDAYNAYLRGRFYLNKWTEEGFEKSIDFFEAAIGMDPSMAVAYAGLADAQFVLSCYGKRPPRELMPKARAAAEKALELDESLAEPHVSLAAVRAIYDWDRVGSEKEFRRAIELRPDLATAHQWYGILCLLPQGRIEEALGSIKWAEDLDPLSPIITTSLGLAYFFQGRFDEAIACLKKALEIDSGFSLAHWWLGVIYLHRSMLLKAMTEFRKAGALAGKSPFDATHFTFGDALIGRHAKARKTLEELRRLSQKQYISPVLIAAISVALGEVDEAFEWLDKAYQARDGWLVWLKLDRRFDRVRGDPRFTALLQKVGIAGGRALATTT